MNKLTIIPDDNTVYVDGVALSGLDLAFIPDEVHALQWVGTMEPPEGWIEYKLGGNEPIESLPDWAVQAQEVWQNRMDEINNPPVLPLTQQDFINAIKQLLNDTAVARNYESEYSIASYANSTNPTWKADAETYIAWRDAVWAYGYAELAAIEGGAPVPTIENFIAAAPQINW